MTDEEYLKAVDDFIKITADLASAAILLDTETALRNPHRRNEHNFLEVLVDRSNSSSRRLSGVAAHAVAVGKACGKLTEDDLKALDFFVPMPNEPIPFGTDSAAIVPSDPNWIDRLKQKIGALRK